MKNMQLKLYFFSSISLPLPRWINSITDAFETTSLNGLILQCIKHEWMEVFMETYLQNKHAKKVQSNTKVEQEKGKVFFSCLF